MRITMPMCAALLVCCQLAAQETREKTNGSGVSATENRTVSDFNKVELKGVGNVNIEIGDSFDVQVSADDNILPLLTTEVVDEALEIDMQDNISIEPKVTISVEIKMPALSAVSLLGAGNISIGELQAAPLAVELSGCGSISAQGQVDGLTLDIAGSGEVDFSNLDTSDADVEIAGVGNVKLSAEKTLKVSIAGVGNVHYDGNPQITKSIKGIGKVRKNDSSEKAGSQ